MEMSIIKTCKEKSNAKDKQDMQSKYLVNCVCIIPLVNFYLQTNFSTYYILPQFHYTPRNLSRGVKTIDTQWILEF